MTRQAIYAAFVALLVVGGASAAMAATDSASSVASQETTTEQETTVAQEQANVTFNNQSSNGTAVVVNSSVLPEGGYLVIHASEDGEAGEVLGNSSYFEPGEQENVTVMLDAPLDESQELIAMAHQDTNDNQVYEFPEADDPYTVDGDAVTDAANVTVENETMMGTETTTEEM